MSDLVQRLRQESADIAVQPLHDLVSASADELERLQTKVIALRLYNELLENAKPMPMADCEVFCKTAVELTAEVLRLREAIRLAREAITEYVRCDDMLFPSAPPFQTMNAKDGLRAALAALNAAMADPLAPRESTS